MLAGPIEASLRSAPAIDEAIVFGASRPTLGVLVIPSALPRVDHSAIIQAVQELNKISASHQEILDQMIVILPVDSTFPKASKGTVLRPKALDKFRDVIEEVYSRLESGRVRGDAGDVTVEDNDLTEYVRNAVKHGLPNSEDEIRDDDDLFVAGVTSLKASQIRGTLHQVRRRVHVFLPMMPHKSIRDTGVTSGCGRFAPQRSVRVPFHPKVGFTPLLDRPITYVIIAQAH